MASSSRQRIVLTLALATSMAVAGALSPGSVRAQVYGQNAPVRISGYMFHPSVLHITSGATVAWTNYDGYAHTTTSDTGAWNSGSLSPGASFHHTFTTPGTYHYHCMIHPFMHGVIVVHSMTRQVGATVNPVMNGGRTVVFGRDFTPHARVFVQWRRPDGTMTGFWTITSWDGSFAFTLFADPRHGCGPRTFMVFDSAAHTWSPQFVLNETC